MSSATAIEQKNIDQLELEKKEYHNKNGLEKDTYLFWLNAPYAFVNSILLFLLIYLGGYFFNTDTSSISIYNFTMSCLFFLISGMILSQYRIRTSDSEWGMEMYTIVFFFLLFIGIVIKILCYFFSISISFFALIPLLYYVTVFLHSISYIFNIKSDNVFFANLLGSLPGLFFYKFMDNWLSLSSENLFALSIVITYMAISVFSDKKI